MKREVQSPCPTQHSDLLLSVRLFVCLLVWYFFGIKLTDTLGFFFLSVFLITTLQRKAVTKHTQEVALAKEKKKEKSPLAYVH